MDYEAIAQRHKNQSRKWRKGEVIAACKDAVEEAGYSKKTLARTPMVRAKVMGYIQHLDRPFTVAEIAETTGEPPHEINNALRHFQHAGAGVRVVGKKVASAKGGRSFNVWKLN